MPPSRLLSLVAAGWLLSIPPAWSAPGLPAAFIEDLEALEQRLAADDGPAVEQRARAQAERLAGGNAADRWARALYLQLAAGAAAQQQDQAAAADYLAQAQRIEGVEALYRDRWQRDEARLRLALGEQERGAELLADWLESHPGEPRDYWRLAGALAEQERWEAAANWVQKALTATPQPEARQRALAAVVLRKAGREDEALSLLATGLADSRDPLRWREAAALAQHAGDDGRAAAIWETGWRKGVLSGSEDLKHLIELHLTGGTPARAAEHLEAALKSGELEDSEANRRLLAQAWEHARDHERALAAWQTVAERSGASDDWRRLGRLAHAWGRDELAERVLSRSALRPESQELGLWRLPHPINLAHEGRQRVEQRPAVTARQHAAVE